MAKCEFGSADLKCAHRFLRIHVHVAHEPARLVRADRQHHQIEGSEAPADLVERGMQRGIPREVHAHTVGLDRPAAPERAVAIAEAARAEMLGGRTCCGETGHLDRLPPVTLDGAPHAM